jgi:hypothetical protein
MTDARPESYTVTEYVIESARTGTDSWITCYITFDPDNWRSQLPGPDHRRTRVFRLVKRTAVIVITDEILDDDHPDTVTLGGRQDPGT